MTTTRRIDKLPKWAQERIRNLEKERKDLLEKIGTLSHAGSPSKTRTRITQGYDLEPGATGPARYLLDEEHIAFALKKYLDGRPVNVDAYLEGDELAIRGTVRLVIRPEAANSFRIGIAGDDDRFMRSFDD